MSWQYRNCPICSDGGYAYGEKKAKPTASLLMFVSTIGTPRRQKSSGSLAACPDCIAKICDGKPLPKKLRDGIADACKALGIQLQRALPLDVKPAKRRGMIRGKR